MAGSELDTIATTRLRRDSQRYTENRRELVLLLSETTDPLTIPEILDRRPDLASSSVYRNLAVLERAGVVQRIVTSNEWARYELAEEFTEHHHHLICSQCGIVRDFTVSPDLEHAIDEALVGIAAAAGFHLEHHTLDLVGLCLGCAAASSSNGTRHGPHG
jgi:Fur family transcriptional regulator, ferric uptake regulator